MDTHFKVKVNVSFIQTLFVLSNLISAKAKSAKITLKSFETENFGAIVVNDILSSL